LARDRRLVPAFRQRLQQLESLPPALPPAAVEEILRRELGPLERRGIALAPPILAEGSVAVVVPFQQRHGGPGGVFKVLKPGIEDRLERELAALARVGACLDEECDDLGIPHLDYQEALEQVRDKLREEVHLGHEQRHLREAAALYRGDPRVHIPAVLEHCTRRVTAMERITGGKITEHPHRTPAVRRRLAELAAGALLARPLFSRDAGTLFHADPHAGNLVLTGDGRLGILDWSLVARLRERERVAMVQILLGALALSPARVAGAAETLAEPGRVDGAALRGVAQAWVERVRGGAFPGMMWLTGMLDDAIQHGKMRVRADLMLFRRAVHSLQGVLADIHAAGTAADWAVARALLGHLAEEWPARFVLPATSRAYATRISTAELAELMLALPWSAAQIWLESLARVPWPRACPALKSA
jgi:predicted unusual protein kinase regulating ubiquinone biosynthesis (AarF/ABC1/UbiB family)